LIRKIVIGAAALLLLASLVSPAFAQTSGSPQISLTHQYRITDFGVGILNDTITFTNSGTSVEQIPSVQLGVPDSVSIHATGFILTPSSEYTMSNDNVDGVTVFTISPVSPSLATNGSSTVSLETYLTGNLNITAGSKTNWYDLLLLSPSLNQQVTTFTSSVVVPESASFSPVPSISGTSFNSSLGLTPPRYTLSESNVTPTVVTESSVFNDTNQAVFLPVQVYDVLRTIVPSTDGLPQVQDQVTLRNLAYYSISSLPLVLLLSSITRVTIIPSTFTPTINPTPVNLTNSALTLTSAPFVAAIAPGDNFTFTMAYTVPKTMVTTSGTTVSVVTPYILPIRTLVQNYTVRLQPSDGVSGVGKTVVHVNDASSITPGNVTIAYRISAGWGADQAVPAASLVFAAAFILLVMTGSSTVSEEQSEEEGEEEKKETSTKLADLIKALEDKLALIEDSVAGIAAKPPGAVTRAEFLKIRTELDSLKSRAFHRLNEAKQATESKRLQDVLNQILEAERDEDRAAKDLLNLYEQYQGKKMREETFQRLLPNYRKRLSSSTNRVSDLLNMAQKESVEG
jgi:hypothetical protein